MKTKRNILTAVMMIAAIGLLAGAAQGALVIDDSYWEGATGGAQGTFTYSSFDASASEKLVVMVGSRRDRDSALSINSVTYGGVAMIEAVEQRSGNSVEESTAIYYLDDPGAAGPIVVGHNARAWSNESGISVMALSGTADGVAATAGAIGTSTSLNTLVDDTIVVAACEKLTNQGSPPAPVAPLNSLSTGRPGSGYQFVPVAGVVTPTFSGNGATTVAAAFEAAAGGGELAGELGILDLTANGGINPATGAPWQEDDEYRFAFFTSARTTAESPDIATYNGWVQGLADASTAYDIGAADGATWKAIGSTTDVDARDNTSTNPTVESGHAIFLLDGSTVVANDYADLWDGAVQHIIDLTEQGVESTHWPWTGTYRDGTASEDHGNSYGALGHGILTDQVGQGQSGLASNWIWRTWTGAPYTNELQMYALSDPLTIRAGEVPEPATLALLGLAACGLGGYVRRRRRA